MCIIEKMVDQAISLPLSKKLEQEIRKHEWLIDCRRSNLHCYEGVFAQHGCVAE